MTGLGVWPANMGGRGKGAIELLGLEINEYIQSFQKLGEIDRASDRGAEAQKGRENDSKEIGLGNSEREENRDNVMYYEDSKTTAARCSNYLSCSAGMVSS